MAERSGRKRSAPNDALTAPSDDDSTFPHFATNAIHAGQDPDQWKCHAVVPGLFLSTTFKQDEPGQPVSESVLSVFSYILTAMFLSKCLFIIKHVALLQTPSVPPFAYGLCQPLACAPLVRGDRMLQMAVGCRL